MKITDELLEVIDGGKRGEEIIESLFNSVEREVSRARNYMESERPKRTPWKDKVYVEMLCVRHIAMSEAFLDLYIKLLPIFRDSCDGAMFGDFHGLLETRMERLKELGEEVNKESSK